MMNPQQAQERCAALIDRAVKLGADAGDAIYIGQSSESVTVRLGKLEDVERSEGEHVGLRLFVSRGDKGWASASIGSTDLQDGALDELASRAIAMARAAPDDAYAGLAPQALLQQGPAPVLALLDPAEHSPAALRALATETEDAARAVAGVTNSEGGSASTGNGVIALATSHGFAGSYASSSISLSASVIAGEGGGMQRDYDWHAARFFEDLDSAAQIGSSAGARAVRRLNPGKLASGVMPVVFDPRVSPSFLGYVASAIAGSAIARRSSFLLDHLGKTLFDRSISILDDPLRPRGLRSRPFDGEGLPTAPFALIDQGRLTGWMMDSAAARQLGLAPTGHASRGASGPPGVSPSNLHMAAGSLSPAALIADIADGVYVTELIGQGVNLLTGDYSRGASGYRIINGEIAGPVAEFTVAGNLLDMFARMQVADDLAFRHAINAPTIRIDGMMIAGS